MEETTPSRRAFIAATAKLASAAWITMNWADIAAAAEHGGHAAGPAPTRFTTLTAAEATEVEAIANQIVPGGETPGAREARAVYFIDNALGSFFAAQLPAFRQGLVEFQGAYAARGGGGKFSAASDAQQIAFLKQVDKTPFFTAVRRLTVLGLTSWPKYGGNHDNLGWKLLGVEESHIWAPPFGHYDQDYAGFEPYPGTKILTA